RSRVRFAGGCTVAFGTNEVNAFAYEIFRIETPDGKICIENIPSSVAVGRLEHDWLTDKPQSKHDLPFIVPENAVGLNFSNERAWTVVGRREFFWERF